MAFMKITTAQAETLLKARSSSNRRSIKRSVFAGIHRTFPMTRGHKLAIFIENPENPLYCVLRDKRTKMPLDDGVPAPVAAKAPAKVAAKAPAKVAAKAQLDVRITVNGQRIRLGYAADEAAKAKMIAKYKKANGIK